MAKKKKHIAPQIIIKAPRRETSDIGVWRAALKSADNERMTKLYELYEDLLIDGVLSDAADKRIDAIANSELTFQDAQGKEVEAMTDLIDTTDFEEFLKLIMKQKTYGRSAFEFDFSQGFRVSEIPSHHINLKKKQILVRSSDLDGISYEKLPNVVVLGKPRDYGLFLKTAPYAIYKRGGFGDYAQWLEIFGMPQRVGKYNAYDTESKRQLEEAMERAGSAPWLVIPKEADVETTNNTGSGQSGISYNDFRKACNEEILITMQGQILTTIAGDKGARSLGEVHQDISAQKHLSDMRFAQRVLNYTVLPILEARGFPVKGGKFLFPKQAEPLEVSEIVQLSSIVDIPQSWLYDKYGIPIPKGDEKLAKTDREETKEPNETKGKTEGGKEKNTKNSSKETKPAETPPPKKPSTKPTALNDFTKKRNFLQRLYDFFAQAPALTGAAGSHLTLSNSLNDGIIGRIDGKQQFDVELWQFFRDDFLRALQIENATSELSDTAFAYGYESDAFKTAQELNIFHFGAAKTLAEITELNRIYRESGSFEEFYQKAQKVTDTFNKVWQKTEHQTATLIAEAADNYQRLIKKTKLFPYWEYKTVGDDKVRPEHDALDGLILPANDPRWKKIFPPNGWKCRCYIVPRMAHEVKTVNFTAMRERADAYLASPDFEKAKTQGFGVNRALSAEVFKENQMYLKKFPTMAKKLLKDVNYKTYKLGSYEQNRKAAQSELAHYRGKAADFFKTLETEDGKLFFEDYKKRKVLFDEAKYLKGHDAAKYAERTKYIEAAAQTLKTADEVWINATEKTLDQFVFIKYYKNEAVAVITEIREGKIYRVKTWFPLKENRKTQKYRSGLLIQKKQP